MSEFIKYHDNTLPGLGYGADGMLTDNWDPDKDYGNEYVKVYFRINCPLYMRGKFSLSFDSTEDHLIFDRDVEEVFTKLGWKIDKLPNGGCCMEISKGLQSLYLHPQGFSGNLIKNEVKRTAEALRFNKTFNLEWVDLYETKYDISDEECWERLLQKKDKIRELILTAARTSQRKFFVHEEDVIEKVSLVVREKRIYEKEHFVVDHITPRFVQGILEELIAEGLIIHVGDDLIRSANKTELKKVRKEKA